LKMDNLRIAFIGTGSMGSAVLDGLVAAGHPKALISATTRTEAKAKALRDRGISALAGETAPDANALMAGDADLIVLGVKPYQIVDVLTELKGEIGKNAVVISMAAGIKLATMAAVLDENPNIIRTMPNTPALVGKGVTGLASAATASQDAVDAAKALFEAVGAVLVIPEEQIDALSAVSGSGPAWVYYIIEQWEKVAVSQGFSEEDAKLLVRQTLAGSVELLESTGEEPADLRKKVTSPGGTTERIIATMEQADLHGIFDASLKAAVARAVEIANS
jgi:pyrroline-5-carboxylate reductase